MNFESIADRTRRAMGGMLEALTEEFVAAGADKTDAITGMVAGNLAQAVLFHFNMHAQMGVTIADARAELDRQLNEYWTQKVVQHIGGVVRTVQ